MLKRILALCGLLLALAAPAAAQFQMPGDHVHRANPQGFVNFQAFYGNGTTTVTYTWAVPKGVSVVYITLFDGGGGGGGGQASANTAGGGGGGGGGGFLNIPMPVFPGELLTIQVGGGGLGGVVGSAGTSGTASFVFGTAPVPAWNTPDRHFGGVNGNAGSAGTGGSGGQGMGVNYPAGGAAGANGPDNQEWLYPHLWGGGAGGGGGNTAGTAGHGGASIWEFATSNQGTGNGAGGGGGNGAGINGSQQSGGSGGAVGVAGSAPCTFCFGAGGGGGGANAAGGNGQAGFVIIYW